MPSTDVNAIAESIESYIRERFRVGKNDRTFSRTVNLWDKGYIDSQAIMELITFIEKTYSVSVPDDALFDEERRSINALAEMVAELTA